MHKNNQHRKHSGFSLIEVLVVVGIAAILGVASFLTLSSSRHTTNLNDAASQIQATLREAQSNSVAQLKGMAWGVRFINATNVQPYYALYGSPYSSSTITDTVSLPSDVAFVTSTIPAGSSVDVLFSSLSGGTSSTTIGLYLKSDPTKNVMVYVNTLGATALSPKGFGSGFQLAATPIATPPGGNYTGSQSVALTCGTPSSTIYYTIDGSIPTHSSASYSTPISVTVNKTINAICVASGYGDSAMLAAVYAIGLPAAATPTALPVAGTYTSFQSVALSCTTPSPTIYYTTDGSTPTHSSASYASPINVTSTRTINAICSASSYADSAMLAAAYTINLPVAATPTASPVAGTYTSAQSVTLSCSTTGSTIYYTTDGSTPMHSSSAYSTPINVIANETLNAICSASGYADSTMLGAVYTINNTYTQNTAGAFNAGTFVSTNVVGSSVALVNTPTTTFTNYTGGGLSEVRIAYDGIGDMWVMNDNSGCSVTKISNLSGTPTLTNYTGGGLNFPYGAASDGIGDMWIVNSNSTVTKISNLSGTPTMTNYAYATSTSAYAIASDGIGDMWGVNPYTRNNSTKISNLSGTPTMTTYFIGNMSDPYGIASDGIGDMWAANYSGASVTKISNLSGTPTMTNYTGGGLNGPQGVASDGAGDIWVTNSIATSVTRISNLSGTPTLTNYTGGGIVSPQDIVSDGIGNMWVTDYNSGVTKISNPSGTPTFTHYTGGGLSNNIDLASDGVGDIWVVNDTNTNASVTSIVPTPNYGSSGTFQSSAMNITSAIHSYGTFAWINSNPASTNITMQARSANNSSMTNATAWGSCGIVSGAALTTDSCINMGDTYIQYQATFSTTDSTKTPSLGSVTVTD